MNIDQKIRRLNFAFYALAIVCLSYALALVFGDKGLTFIKANIVNVEQHAPFDGTSYPVKKVPDWVKMDSSKRYAHYEEFSSSELIDIPNYNPAELKIPSDSLSWTGENDLRIRNSKITYSVPYLGNYELDGIENAGSHPAVDIKIPTGTPIYSIANGKVIKVSKKNTGFGFHIVIEHNNVPSFDDPNKKVTLYSSYSHMDSIKVNEGDIVTRDQLIGKSGESGTATTPHLHFQIDNVSAPWHPFWPFSFKEASDAGYDFFTAINAGFGKDKAAATTINPVEYVEKYLNGEVNITPQNETEQVLDKPKSSYLNSLTDEEKDEDEFDEVKVDQNSSEESSYASSYVSENSEKVSLADMNKELLENKIVDDKVKVKVNARKTYYTKVDNSAAIVLQKNGDNFVESFDSKVIVYSENGLLDIEKSELFYANFDNGYFNLKFRVNELGSDRIVVEFEGEKYYSDIFNTKDSSSISFSDLKSGNEEYEAVMFLAKQGIVNGYDDGSFKPDKEVSRVEALKLIFESVNKNLEDGSLSFSDTPNEDWYKNYLVTAVNDSIVSGYEDNTFRPHNTVSKSEFLKIMFKGSDLEVEEDVKYAPFTDVKIGEWYTPFVSKAKGMGIIDSNAKTFSPTSPMTRGEVAVAMYRLQNLN